MKHEALWHRLPSRCAARRSRFPSLPAGCKPKAAADLLGQLLDKLPADCCFCLATAIVLLQGEWHQTPFAMDSRQASQPCVRSNLSTPISNQGLPMGTPRMQVSVGSRQLLAVRPTRRERPMASDDYLMIVEWLKVSENFTILTSAGRKMKIAGKTFSKTNAFATMAAVLVELGFPPVDGKNMRKRFERYMTLFKKAVELKNAQTGAGLTEAKVAAGMTIGDKLEHKCYHFDRMYALFGERANISPPSLLT